MARKFKIATAAGTFDHFHKGHKAFLKKAFELADTIYIGITTDIFAKSKRQETDVAPCEERKKEVENFLKDNGLYDRARVIELNDIYGPTLEPYCPIEAIIVTEKTRYGAELINKLRKQKGLPALIIEEMPIEVAQDGGDLSSSRIRNKEIDKEGNAYDS